MKQRILPLMLALILCLGLFVIPAGAEDHSYKSWNQGDPRWGSMSISSLGYGHSMASEGCYVTAVAKLLVHAAQQDQNNFTPKTCLNKLFAYGMLDSAGNLNTYKFNSGFLADCAPQLWKEDSDAHSGWEWDRAKAISEFSSRISNGYYVIVGVTNYSSGNSHYMAVDYVSDDVYVMDNGGTIGLYGSGKYSGVIDQLYFKYSGPYAYPAIDNMEPLEAAKIQPDLYYLTPMCAPDSRLKVADGSVNSQANVQIWSADADPSQQWSIEVVDNQYYKLISKRSGLALDVAGAGTVAGTNVQQYPWTGHTAQQWRFIDVGDGYYQIASRLDPDLRLDVSGGVAADGTNVQIWTDSGGTSQKWKLTPVSSEPDCSMGHTWGQWITVIEATPNVEGQRKRTCSVCGKTETETIPALAAKPDEPTSKIQYRYHRYEDNNGEYAVCAYWGNVTYNTTMHIAYTDWLDTPLPEVKEGYVNFLEHPNRGANCTNAGCLASDPFEVHRHVDDTGKVWYYEETRTVPVEPAPTPAPDAGDLAPVQELHFAKQTVYFQGQFSDVDAGQWFSEGVSEAFELGLMKGVSKDTFAPYGDVTLAEAITMACRIHSIYTTGREEFDQSSGEWYQAYLDYAYQNGIISWAYYNADVTHKATRAQMAEIFAGALPAEALGAINLVEDDAIPDVSMAEEYAPSVYTLYRAGVLTGGDANGTFSPQTYITRAEAAAIVSRMAESDNRVYFSL